MTISITIDGHSAEHVRSEMAKLLGTTSLDQIAVTDKIGDVLTPPVQKQGPQELDYSGEKLPVGETRDEQFNEPEVAAAPTRERGKPSPGHARRTKAEIAEDDAYEATQTRAIPPAGEAVAAISTGEERVGPEDDAATAEQDAVDEAAETAAAKIAAGSKLTLDDVRNALGLYVQKYGMEAAQEDGQKAYVLICGPSTFKDDKGNPRAWKTSDLPDDQAIIGKVVDGINEMTTKNPFKREAKAA